MKSWEIVDYLKLQQDIIKAFYDKEIRRTKYLKVAEGDYEGNNFIVIDSRILIIMPEHFNYISYEYADQLSRPEKLIPDLSYYKDAKDWRKLISIDKGLIRVIEDKETEVKVDNKLLKYFNLDNISFLIAKPTMPVLIARKDYDYLTKEEIIGLVMPIA